MAFDRLIRLIQNGEAVDAPITNRPLRTLDANTRYLYDLILGLSAGQAIYARRVTVASSVVVGTPVYYDADDEEFKPGLAQLDSDSGTGYRAADSARVWGVVAEKINATLADVLLFGRVAMDLTAVAGGNSAGEYYLSPSVAGTLTTTRPTPAVFVLRADGQGNVLVSPQVSDLTDGHVHRRFELTCAPAGQTSPPATDERHTIVSPDADLPGWLPADHYLFDGRAPTGAVFGYNLAADPTLAGAWPPRPISQAYLEWDRGSDPSSGYQGVQLGRHGMAILNDDGIWWLRDCYGDAPWSVDTDTASSASDSTSESEAECPRNIVRRMAIWFNKPTLGTEGMLVRSLRSLDPRITIRCANGAEGSVGDLVVLLDLALGLVEDQTGYQVIKGIDGSNFLRGPVVEGLYAVNSQIELTGSVSRPISGSDSRTLYGGLVGVSVVSADSRVLQTQLIRLAGTTEEFIEDLMGIGMPAGRESELRGKIDIPIDCPYDDPTLALRLWILGSSSGTLPQLTVTARRIPVPTDGLDTPMTLPTTVAEFSVTIPTDGVLSGSNQYVEALSEPFEVAAGDRVFYTITREDSDGYAGDVVLLDQAGVLAAAE